MSEDQKKIITKEGLRFNEGKTRHDLVPAFAQEQYAKVLTKGAEKYAERNWEKGMAWSKVLSSLKRHILAFEKGEDFDKVDPKVAQTKAGKEEAYRRIKENMPKISEEVESVIESAPSEVEVSSDTPVRNGLMARRK